MTKATPTKNNISTMPALENFTPEQALSHVLNEIKAGDEYEGLIIIGNLKESGGLVIRSSEITRSDANWLLDRAKFFNLEMDG